MYLLDTNVISEFRRAESCKADRNVIRWAESALPASMFLSAITILELELGCLLMERRDAAHGALLRLWLEDFVLPGFDDRVLAVDTEIARRSAAMHVPNPCSYRDALIAATAIVHRMTVVTRNVSHFDRTGVAILNPWDA
jgi:predicted nucleic acid-binding protein